MNFEKKKPATRFIDEESESILFEGASLIQLERLFGRDARDIKAKIVQNGIKPRGERRGHAIYAISDVAPYVVSYPFDVDDLIQRMTVADLPMLLRKEYWAGMRSRQLYEKEAAELWPTDSVVDIVSDLLKTLRMSLLLSREAVERETELTDRQRAIITRIIDNALEDCHATTTHRFAEAAARASANGGSAETSAGQAEL